MKPFSIYFPQFYPTPTNDKVWGKGFTDWALVAHANLHERWARRAPRRGFYDGADPRIHHAQMEEMVASGLGGIGVYHYWFYSHQELASFEQTLLSGHSRTDLPWFLVWASEGWSRRWLGDPSPITTLSKDPSAAEIEKHCEYLLRCFELPSYFRWKGKPFFVWYHLDHFSNPPQVVDQYRETLLRRGVEIVTGHFVKNPSDARHCSVADVSYLFEPRLYFGTQRAARGTRAKKAFDRVQRLLGESAAQRLLMLFDRVQQKGHTYAAEDYLRYMYSQERINFVSSLPGQVQDVISPGWNNTPRYDTRFTALQDVAPEKFGELVRQAASRVDSPPPLINAWNEWSEGAAIEPCAYYGSRYLDALKASNRVSPSPSVVLSEQPS